MPDERPELDKLTVIVKARTIKGVHHECKYTLDPSVYRIELIDNPPEEPITYPEQFYVFHTPRPQMLKLGGQVVEYKIIK